MAALGLDDETQVVAYDNGGGMFAARLWWMLRWLGHDAVALLDGGLAAWRAAGRELVAEIVPAPVTGSFTLRASRVELLSFDDVRANVYRPARLLLDARAPDRFRGENETLDPVGGRIPGARNRFFRDNLAPDGRFKDAVQLRREFEAVMDGRAGSSVIHSCGSGVTACHNVLAMELAGLGGAALYAGSWSEWCAQPGAPVASGAA
jgi:thiosulfate/3-mercaptopyruvate sulfurtransferase